MVFGLFFYGVITAQFARFKRFTVEDGLTQNSVISMEQDKKGFIWIGTYNGLNKYDGHKITTYKASTEDTNTIYHNNIRCLYADNDNNLWGGTGGGGLFRINLVTGKITNFHFDSLNANCLSNDYVNAIKEFEPGKLYIATNDGLNIFDKVNETFTVYRKIGKNSLPILSDKIKQIVKDPNGHLWFSHLNAGITEYDPKTGKCNYYSANDKINALNSNNIRAIYADRRGLIWVSCWNAGANIIDTKTGKVFGQRGDTAGRFRVLQQAALISQFYEDNKGQIWWATAEKGLGRVAIDHSFVDFFENNKDDNETISDNTVFCIMQDRSGLLWAGTWQGGVNMLNLHALNFGYYKHQGNKSNSLSDNTVNAFGKKSKHEVYIGHSSSADIFNTRTRTFSKFPINEADPYSLRSNSIVLGVYADKKDSSVWFSTSGGFPYRYNSKTKKFRNYLYKGNVNDFGHHTSFTILRDNADKLWIASSLKGLYLYDDEKDNFIAFQSKRGNAQALTGNSLLSIVKRHDGKFWINTLDSGLNLFDPISKINKQFFKHPDGKPVFKDGAISVVFEDAQKNVWLGTALGLLLFDPEKRTSKNFAELDPVFKSVVFGILQDNKGDIWVATDNGLIDFNYSKNTFRVFKKEDGLQGREFSLNAAYKTEDGMLLFGGNNGFNAFKPDQLEFNTVAPQVAFTDFSVQNKPYQLPIDISYINEIRLSYKDYFFSFDFAALDFTDLSRNIYEYKLEGFNENWVNIGNKHQVTFTNLDPGTYTLLVRATNNNGVMCKAPASVKIIITPPFWRTTWFYVLCVLTVIIIVYGYIKYREKKLIKEKAVLENKVEERTLELKEEKQKVELAHKDIKDSINYAKRIQEAILPLKETISKYLKSYFILYKPKDIVAGDFYWFHALPQDNSVLIAAIDCTGHGVPGAFMSMIGNEQLSKIINEKNITQPDLILNELHKGIRAALKQDQMQGETRDGMDIALCKVDLKNNNLEYAGAMRPLWLVRNNELLEVKADKQPIGGLDADYRKPFTNNKVDLQSGDTLYMFTDGFADQFGGEKGKKFMLKNFEKLLLEINAETLNAQEDILNKRIEAWKGAHEQIDDILVIGIRI